MSSRSRESKPASVPRGTGTKQVGEVRSRWQWTERTVWTDRMLRALEHGVKGGVWFSLIDKVSRVSNLDAAFAKVKANAGAAGCDHETIVMYESRLEANLQKQSEELLAGVYGPQKVRRTHIPKPGSDEQRPLGIPTVRDRVTQTAIRHVIEPIFERDFAEHSYGFRPGRGCKDALRRVDALLKSGYTHVVDVDLQRYFDTIPHDALMDQIRTKIADGRVLKLIESFLTQNVMQGLEEWTPTAGSPQGAAISPLLSNIYLDPLDHLMEASGFEMVRYADDMVILCRTHTEAQAALAEIQRWTEQAELVLHPEKTRVVDTAHDGFDFLGYHFERDKHWPRDRSIKRFKETIRRRTPRNSGQSLKTIIGNVNKTLRGWFAYFKHASYASMFRQLDGWLRRRLRRILLKRHKVRRHNGCGLAHQRWPNAFFAEQGLFSMEAAHARARQSAMR